MSPRYRVVVLEHQFPNLEPERQTLEPLGAEVIDAERFDDTRRREVCREADALMLRRTPITAELIETLERCRIICTYAAGYDRIDLAAAARRGIMVANTPGYANEEVADQALAFILGLARRVRPQMRDLAAAAEAGTTPGWTHHPYMPIRRLSRQTLGIVGLGRIGRTLVWKARGIGLRTIATDPYLAPETAAALGAPLTPLDELLSTADFVSLHTPLTPETRHLIARAELARMKPTAYLINCARGPVVDHRALIDALRRGTIAGAGLDVLESEPPPADLLRELLTFPNVLLTAHTAWYAEESIEDRQRLAAETVAAALRGERPASVVNTPARDV